MTLYADITDDYIDESAGEVYDPDYLCGVEYGGLPCPLSAYANYSLNICEELLCLDTNGSCFPLGIIPPQGRLIRIYLTNCVYYLITYGCLKRIKHFIVFFRHCLWRRPAML